MQKIAEVLKINPFALLSATTANHIVSGDNSPNANITLNDSQWNNADPDHGKMLMALMEKMIQLSDKLLELKK